MKKGFIALILTGLVAGITRNPHLTMLGAIITFILFV